MNTAARVAQLTVRVVGLLALILGLLFWGGDARQLIPVHMLLGLIVVIALVVLAVAGIMAGRAGLGVGGIVVAVLLLVVGMGQQQMLPGPNHWLVQVLHILLGMGAIGYGEVLGKRLGLTGAARARVR
ncbi:MAG TPA: hypothetical protein VK066_26110 [Chloroflexota bacterium]|nr:hypothetical protein [Chloroflexota bacterium]